MVENAHALDFDHRLNTSSYVNVALEQEEEAIDRVEVHRRAVRRRARPARVRTSWASPAGPRPLHRPLPTTGHLSRQRFARQTSGTLFRITTRDGALAVERDGEPVAGAGVGDGGWRLSIGGEATGMRMAGDAAAVMTGTAADILILDAAVGLLPAGESRDLVAWHCGPRLDCGGVEAERMTVTGMGTQLIRGHRIFESTNAYAMGPADGGDTGHVDYWIAPPGLFSGGPVRIEADGVSSWRRIR